MSETVPRITDEQAEVLDKLADTEDATGEEAEGGGTPYVSFASKEAFQEAIDARLKERMERLERKQADEKQKAEAEAREKALQENEEFKELAEERQRRIAELEKSLEESNPYKESSERYKAALEEHVTQAMEGLPDYIPPLLEGKDPVEKLTWLNENREKVVPSDGPRGVPPTPPAGDPNDLSADQRQANEERARRQLHQMF